MKVIVGSELGNRWHFTKGVVGKFEIQDSFIVIYSEAIRIRRNSLEYRTGLESIF